MTSPRFTEKSQATCNAGNVFQIYCPQHLPKGYARYSAKHRGNVVGERTDDQGTVSLAAHTHQLWSARTPDIFNPSLDEVLACPACNPGQYAKNAHHRRKATP